MKLPRDLSGAALAQILQQFGYQTGRQTGSASPLSRTAGITIPNHSPIKIGTLNAILRDIAAHFDLTRDQLAERLFP